VKQYIARQENIQNNIAFSNSYEVWTNVGHGQTVVVVMVSVTIDQAVVVGWHFAQGSVVQTVVVVGRTQLGYTVRSWSFP
jgi:hypothetical protein